MMEGFIHTSKQHQVKGVLERYYAGKSDLLLLTIDPTKLTAPLKYEIAPSVNEWFPHVYGNINIDAVVNIDNIWLAFYKIFQTSQYFWLVLLFAIPAEMLVASSLRRNPFVFSAPIKLLLKRTIFPGI